MKDLLLYQVDLTGLISVWQRRKPVLEKPKHHSQKFLKLVFSSKVFKMSIHAYTYWGRPMATCLGGSTIGSTKQSLDGLCDSRKCLVFRDL